MGLQRDERLGRNLGFFPTFAIGTGTMIGAGIFVLPGIAAASAGPAAIFSFLLGGVISMATALSMAELATGMPRAGGSYYFISRTMGAAFGSIIGLGAWLALVFKGSFALVGLAEYLNILLPVPVLFTAVVAGIGLLFLNYRGAESSGSLQNGIVIGLFIILTLFIGRGLFIMEPGRLQPVMPYGVSSVFATTGLIFVSYLGITQLSAISEEVKNPSKNLPRAFIASVGAVTFLYVGVMLVINGVFPLAEVIELEAPLVAVADVMAGRVGQIVIIVAGFFATVSTANAAIMSSSRFPFAMGRDRLLPDWIIKVHDEYETPYRAIIITGITMIVLLLILEVEDLAKLGSTFNVMIFVLINLSVIVLRKKKQEWFKPTFKSPLYPVPQVIGVVGGLALLPQLGFMPMLFAFAVIVFGVVWFKVYAGRKAEPEYTILDIIEDRPVPSITDARKKKVLVPVSDPEIEMDLLRFADRLSDETVGLNVIEVPDQIGLRDARDADLDELDKEYQKRDNIFCEHAATVEHAERCLTVYDHSIPAAILEQADLERPDMIIMGWQREDRFRSNIGGVTGKVLKRARTNIGILKGHFPEELNKITVAYDGRENSVYGLYLARRLARSSGAKIELLHVISPDTPADEKARIEQELEKVINEPREASAEINFNEFNCVINYKIEERFSVSDAVIEAADQSDLTIVGDSIRRFKFDLLGGRANRIITHASGNILLVRRYKPFSRETILSNFRKLFRKKEKLKS
ncbi:MAG: amino acid permease [Halarsenatibacteraceae bacterium]